MATRLYKTVLRTVVTPGTPGDPGSPGQPYRAGYWKDKWIHEFDVHRDPPWYWVKIQIWVPEQPYIPPTPPTPPTPAEIAEDYQHGWNAGAVSVETKTGDFAFIFKPGTANIGLVVGLAPPTDTSGESYANIRYGFYIERDQYRVIESGEFRTDPRTFAATAEFRIQRKGGHINYAVDNARILGSLIASVGDLQADCSIYSGNDVIDNAAYGECIDLGDAALDQKFEPLTGRAEEERRKVTATASFEALTGEADCNKPGGQINANLAPLEGSAKEALPKAIGRGTLEPLQGSGNVPTTAQQSDGGLQPLGSTAECAAPKAFSQNVLEALQGAAQCALSAQQSAATLVPLSGIGEGSGTDHVRAEGTLQPFASIASEPETARQSVAQFAPLQGTAHARETEAPKVRAEATFPPFTGLAATQTPAQQADAQMRPLLGSALTRDARTGDGYGHGIASVPPLTGIANGVAGQQIAGELEPLTGHSETRLTDGPRVRAEGTFLPLTGVARAQYMGAQIDALFTTLQGSGRCPLYTIQCNAYGNLMALSGEAGRGYTPATGSGTITPPDGTASYYGSGPPVLAEGRLQAMGGIAHAPTLLIAEATLTPLTGTAKASAQDQPNGIGQFAPLRGIANGSGSAKVYALGSVAPLSGSAQAPLQAAHGIATLSPLTGSGTEPLLASASGTLAPLTGLAIDDDNLAPGIAHAILAPLTSTASAPYSAAASGIAILAPLTGYAHEQDMLDQGLSFGFLDPLQGKAYADRYMLPCVGTASIQPLSGQAGDQERCEARGSVQPMQGHAEPGLIRPPPPIYGWGVLGWMYGWADSSTIPSMSSSSQPLPPLQGQAGDQARVEARGNLQALSGTGACRDYTYCDRYIPRLLLTAFGVRDDPITASLPITLNAVLAEGVAPVSCSVDAWIGQPTTLSAGLSGHIANHGTLDAQMSAGVAKQRRRQVRMSAWIRKPHSSSASLNAAIE